MGNLSVLTVRSGGGSGGWPDREWLLLVAELAPQLRTLHLHGHDAHNSWWSALAQLAQLTDLRTEDLLSHESSGALLVTQCTALHRLHLCGLHGSLWSPILTAPSMQSLRALVLDSLFARHAAGFDEEPTPVGWPCCFSNLRGLQSLGLVNTFGVDSILDALSLSHSDDAGTASSLSSLPCPSLRSLRIQPRHLDCAVAAASPSSNLRRWGPRLPSLSALGQMLTARPRLFLELHLPTLMAHRQRHGHTAAEQLRWKTIRDSFAPLVQLHPQHFAVCLNDRTE
jgi:hypothetical protein